MAKKRGKAKARRRTKKKVNLIGVAEALVLANVTTEGLFNTSLMEFVTGQTTPKQGKGYWPSNTDNVITLPELLGFDRNALQQSSGATPVWIPFSSTGAGEKIKENIKSNGLMMGAQLILIPLAFTGVTKLTRKPRASANKLLDYTGLGVKI